MDISGYALSMTKFISIIQRVFGMARQISMINLGCRLNLIVCHALVLSKLAMMEKRASFGVEFMNFYVNLEKNLRNLKNLKEIKRLKDSKRTKENNETKKMQKEQRKIRNLKNAKRTKNKKVKKRTMIKKLKQKNLKNSKNLQIF